ncbi:hypothetical protein JCGZ_00705 [Jatropha curcas]|uniref:Uncharacterized protein n=3 Tax=Jatropha curcas TaxID=180498 RepID=A0A067KVC9_JATCU|nr:hypothetical protein JCGZ_00705 [Jatropha curcas]
MAFYSCVQYNIQETRNKLANDSDATKFEEEDIILKVGECLEERVKKRSVHSKDALQFTSSAHSMEDFRSATAAGIASAVSFSDEEETEQVSGSRTSGRKQKGSRVVSRSLAASEAGKGKTSTRGRGRGRGRGSSNLKQTTLDAALGFRQSQRSASVAATAAVRSIADEDENVDSASSEDAENNRINEVEDSSDDGGSIQGKGRKRGASRGRGKAAAPSKRGRKSDNSTIQRMLMGKDDDDDDDDDDVAKRLNKSQPRVARNYGALRR